MFTLLFDVMFENSIQMTSFLICVSFDIYFYITITLVNYNNYNAYHFVKIHKWNHLFYLPSAIYNFTGYTIIGLFVHNVYGLTLSAREPSLILTSKDGPRIEKNNL